MTILRNLQSNCNVDTRNISQSIKLLLARHVWRVENVQLNKWDRQLVKQVALPIIGIQFIPRILPKFSFWIFTVNVVYFRASLLQMQRRFSFVLKPRLFTFLNYSPHQVVSLCIPNQQISYSWRFSCAFWELLEQGWYIVCNLVFLKLSLSTMASYFIW